MDMKLHEVVQHTGTYAGVRFDTATNKAIRKYMKDNSVPNAIRTDKLHTTLLYSRKHLPDYKPLGKLSEPLIATPGDFVVWETKPSNPSDKPSRCLVLKIKCPELTERHKKLMKEHGGTYDYDTYETHITLSYDIGNTDIDHLPKFSEFVPQITINEEYGEDLDLDWAAKKGTKG
jgi:hypothetical protein